MPLSVAVPLRIPHEHLAVGVTYYPVWVRAVWDEYRADMRNLAEELAKVHGSPSLQQALVVDMKLCGDWKELTDVLDAFLETFRATAQTSPLGPVTG